MANYSITPNKMIETLTKLYASGKPVPTVMLWGQPGVGKSEGIRGLATNLEKVTEKKVFIHDVRLLLFNPVDLRGIPVADAERKSAKWLKPSIFDMDASKDVVNILFLDELSAAPPSVQASAYQLVLDKKVGEHTLPDNVIVICAGNRVQDKGVAYKMPTPLANRMTHFDIVCDMDDWKQWAIPNQIHPLVLGFLNFKNTMLNKFDPTSDESAFPTPRSWKFVSDFLHMFDGNIEEAYPAIAGSIGEGASIEFKTFAQVYDLLPNVDDILDGKDVRLKGKTPDIVYALSSSLVSKVTKTTDQQLENMFKFVISVELMKEFSILTVKDILKLDGVKMRLVGLPQWNEWVDENVDYIVG